MIPLKYVLAEIKNTKRFSLFFILNLALGMFGFLSLEFFKDSLESTLQSRSRAVLGADLSIQARREFSQEENKIIAKFIPPQTPSSQVLEIFSMVAKPGGNSTLVQIKAIENNFPFYGAIETSPTHIPTSTLNDQPTVWVYPEIISQLGLSIGDSLRIGEADFKIAGIVINDSASGISTSMAPRVYLGLSQFQKTNLLKPGSIAWRVSLYNLAGMEKIQLDLLRDQIFNNMPSADLQVYTHENASEQMGRLLKYLNDFLGLAALVSLFICALGIGFLCYTFLLQRLKSIAILMSLGMPRRHALSLNAIHVLILSLLSSVTAGALAYSSLPLLKRMASLFVNFEIIFQPNPKQLFLTLISCVLGSQLVLLPFLLKIRKVKPNELLQDHITHMPRWDFLSLLGFFPLIAAFYTLAVVQTHSWYNGSIFFAGFAAAVIIFYGIGYTLIPFIKYLPTSKFLSLHWALRDLSRLKFSTLSCFLALSVSLLLLNLIPQIERSIREEIKNPESSKLPGLFLFDIQEEQVAPLKNLLTQNNIELRDISPLIRARLTHLNDEAFSKGVGVARARTREEEQEMQFRNRGFNLSYRDRLSTSEKIVKGDDFSPSAESIAQLSIEEGFAKKLNLKIGDILTFDIQSVPIKGKIVNLRSVQWTSFQPNFFVLFQPGFLEAAPKTFLATLPKMDNADKINLQDQIVSQLPNVSMIDIARLVARIQDIVFHISWSLRVMLILTLVVGFSVLFSISNQQAVSRKWDIGLLKSLGASPKNISNSILLQFTIIAFLAASFGFIVSLAFSYVISYFLFNNMWFFDWTTPVLLLVASTSVTFAVVWISLVRSLSTKARDLLGRG